MDDDDTSTPSALLRELGPLPDSPEWDESALLDEAGPGGEVAKLRRLLGSEKRQRIAAEQALEEAAREAQRQRERASRITREAGAAEERARIEATSALRERVKLLEEEVKSARLKMERQFGSGEGECVLVAGVELRGEIATEWRRLADRVGDAEHRAELAERNAEAMLEQMGAIAEESVADRQEKDAAELEAAELRLEVQKAGEELMEMQKRMKEVEEQNERRNAVMEQTSKASKETVRALQQEHQIEMARLEARMTSMQREVRSKVGECRIVKENAAAAMRALAAEHESELSEAYVARDKALACTTLATVAVRWGIRRKGFAFSKWRRKRSSGSGEEGRRAVAVTLLFLVLQRIHRVSNVRTCFRAWKRNTTPSPTPHPKPRPLPLSLPRRQSPSPPLRRQSTVRRGKGVRGEEVAKSDARVREKVEELLRGGTGERVRRRVDALLEGLRPSTTSTKTKTESKTKTKTKTKTIPSSSPSSTEALWM